MAMLHPTLRKETPIRKELGLDRCQKLHRRSPMGLPPLPMASPPLVGSPPPLLGSQQPKASPPHMAAPPRLASQQPTASPPPTASRPPTASPPPLGPPQPTASPQPRSHRRRHGRLTHYRRALGATLQPAFISCLFLALVPLLVVLSAMCGVASAPEAAVNRHGPSRGHREHFSLRSQHRAPSGSARAVVGLWDTSLDFDHGTRNGHWLVVERLLQASSSLQTGTSIPRISGLADTIRSHSNVPVGSMCQAVHLLRPHPPSPTDLDQGSGQPGRGRSPSAVIPLVSIQQNSARALDCINSFNHKGWHNKDFSAGGLMRPGPNRWTLHRCTLARTLGSHLCRSHGYRDSRLSATATPSVRKVLRPSGRGT